MTTETGMEAFSNLSRAEFAARCRAARAYLGLRLEDAAPKLGISRQALSRREGAYVDIRTSDRWAMATVYCQLTKWPVEFFTDEKLPPMSLTSLGTGGGEIEPDDVVGLVSEPPDIDALP